MELNGEGRLLRIYIGESDHWHHQPLYEELVQAARRQGLAGATWTFPWEVDTGVMRPWLMVAG
jgi:hypothetical protein